MNKWVLRAAVALVATALATKLADVAVGIADPYGISHFEHKRRFDGTCLRWTSEIPTFTYLEPIPGSFVEDTDPPYRINALGCRGPEIARDKAPGTVRVVLVGDSVGFGWGVREEDTVRARLETALRDWYGPARAVEVVNLCVPGHNAGHELDRFRRHGLALSPDVVIALFNENDVEMFPDESAPLTRMAEARFRDQSLLARWFIDGRSGAATARVLPHLRDLLVYLEIYRHQPAEVSEARRLYRGMARGIAITSTIYGEFATLGAQHGFAFCVFDLSGFEPIAAVARERGIPYANLQLDESRGLQLRNSAADPHPNAAGHALLAEAAFRALTADPSVLPGRSP